MGMSVYSRNWNVDTIVRRKDRIDPKPAYQRGPVWNEPKKQLLIDSILRKYDIPKIYLRKLPPGGRFEHEIADGQQRLRAIWDFVAGNYRLGEASSDIPDFGDLTGKSYADLPTDGTDRIGLYELTIAEVMDATEVEIRDLFLRLQEGVSLNPAERRNAMTGNMRDFIADLGENHRVFALTSIPPRRFAWHDLAAHIACLELAGGPTDVKAANLKKMYESEREINADGPVANRIRRHLNYMARIFAEKPPEMDIKWGFVDLYLAVSKLDPEFVLTSRESDFLTFYVSFEKERRAVTDAADLLAEGKGPWERDLFTYIEAFVREGATKVNIEKRHEVYVKRILRDIADLTPKDQKRGFSRDQKIVIWRRDKETCQMCKTAVRFEEMHADHIVPHVKGGITTVDNAQTLCARCNAQKGGR